MSARAFETQLQGALEVASDEDEFPLASVSTFEDAGILTHNRGLVVRLENGSEFQLTVVQSAYGENEEDDDE